MSPIILTDQDTPLNFNISKNDGMSHKQFISTKNPQKWPPFVVKTYRNSFVFINRRHFQLQSPPWLPSAGSREKCRSCDKVLHWESLQQRAVAATPRHMGWDENTRFHRGKKKLRFSSGRRSLNVFWGLRQRKSGSATCSLFFGSWNWNILKTSDSFCYKGSFSSTC